MLAVIGATRGRGGGPGGRLAGSVSAGDSDRGGCRSAPRPTRPAGCRADHPPTGPARQARPNANMTHPIHFGRIWPTTTARPVSMPSRANPTRMGRKKSFSSKFSVWADAIVRWLWSCARTVSKPTDVQEAHAAEDSPGECPVCQPAITGPHLPGQCHREEHEEQHGPPPIRSNAKSDVRWLPFQAMTCAPVASLPRDLAPRRMRLRRAPPPAPRTRAPTC